MESLPKRRSHLKALLVSAFCIAGASGGGVLLYQDFTDGGAAGRGTPVATLEKREAKVRRKPASSYIWQNIEEAAPLFFKESLQTGPESAAVVRLQDGSVLELGENSLVVIDKTAELSLNYLKGSMILRQSDGDKQITADAAGKQQVKTLDLRLVKPEALAQFFVDGSSAPEVAFEWESKSGTPAVLELSPDRTFRSSRVIRIKPDSGSSAIAKDVPAGQHFWRVVAESGEASPVRTLRISSATTLVPVAPRGDRITSFGGKSPIQFRWLPTRLLASDAVTHEIEISRDASFAEIIAHQSIIPETGVAAVSGMGSGKYYWRAHSRFGKVEKISPVETFEIQHTEEVALKLLGPAREAVLTMQPELRFVWIGGDHPDLAYSWEVQDASGASVTTAKGSATAALWKSVRSGTFKWRVSALWNGKTVGATEWFTFTVSEGEPLALAAPEDAKELLYWDKPAPFSFQWKPDSLQSRGYSYQFQLARDRDFRNIVLSKPTRGTALPSSEIPELNGVQYWRVQVLDPSGRSVKTSEARSIRTGQHPLLAAPNIPADPKTFNLRDDEAAPVLQWASVSEARGYEITFIPVNDGRAPASAAAVIKRTTEPSLALPELPEGRYEWKVQAIDRLKRAGNTSISGAFEVTYGAPLPPPKIKSSEVQ